jgi:hypothetical protein
MTENNKEVYYRQIVSRKKEISFAESVGIAELNRMAHGKINWRLEIEYYYEDSSVYQVWDELETDVEYAHRIKVWEAQEAKRKKERDRKLEKEQKEYERLKKKFEKQ